LQESIFTPRHGLARWQTKKPAHQAPAFLTQPGFI
jgi:hypothetical protein